MLKRYLMDVVLPVRGMSKEGDRMPMEAALRLPMVSLEVDWRARKDAWMPVNQTRAILYVTRG